MDYVYYKSDKGNFGDDLNPWLWPKIFQNTVKKSNLSFLGIGSILFNEFEAIIQLPAEQQKIVFGTGIRPASKPMLFNKNWDILFLRGPLSSFSQQNKYDYITDAAYAIRQISDFSKFLNVKKKYDVSIMPYFKSLKYINWEEICLELGYNYISPFSENGVEHTLKEIAASRVLITEAMHGAIVADIMRVPWKRYILSTPMFEGPKVSEFKWMDWIFSINEKYNDALLIDLYKNNIVKRGIQKITRDSVDINFFIKKKILEDILKQLSKVDDFSMSTDSSIELIDSKINDKIIYLKKKYDLHT